MKHRKKLVALAVIVGVPLAVHGAVGLFTRIEPPKVVTPAARAVEGAPGLFRIGREYTRVRAGLREVHLEGTPEAIGAGMIGLVGDRMVADEAELWDSFVHAVPFAPARALVFDLGRVRYRGVDAGIPEPRRRELAAEAASFVPDPYASHLPTYHRIVFLHALYDIALSFEHSPLLGCSAFAMGPETTSDGHTIVARAFDFEAGDVFDRDKAVYFVRGDGVLPFASVAWPGFVGVVTGMNAEGVFVAVHGARAREPRTDGEPMVFGLREVLEHAHDTAEALKILGEQHVMVSHLVFVADAHGAFAVAERAPGEALFVRGANGARTLAVTNHFEGPLAKDPRDARVRQTSTTLARRARLDEMLAEIGPHEGTIARAVAMLRDHTCAGHEACPLGDRRAIDALIATHGVVADTTDGVLWVSAGPHLSGRFVRFDVRSLLQEGHNPERDAPPDVIAADPILADGRYEEGRARAGGPRYGGDARGP